MLFSEMQVVAASYGHGSGSTEFSSHHQPRIFMKYRALIIEDEEKSRQRLLRLLSDRQQLVEIVGEAENGLEAVEKIRILNPDLLFLDIQLPGLDGFQVVEKLERQPLIIFTTADENKALNAFKTNAIDYLLKPIEPESLDRALNKLRSISPKESMVSETLGNLIRNLGQTYLTRLTCKVGEKIFLVKTGEILYFQADHKYTTVRTSGKTYLIDTPLVELEKKLDPKDFIRIHRGTLVNVAWIAEIRKLYDGKLKVILLDKEGSELTASRIYAENLRNIG